MSRANYDAGVRFWSRLLKSEEAQLARLELLRKAGVKIDGFKGGGSYEMSGPDDYLSPRIAELKKGIKNITRALKLAQKLQQRNANT